MKKIVLMPVKNEDWILEYSLSCASLWADYIIVADQNSTDKTSDICKKFEKVIYIKNTSTLLNMSHARQLLLDEARKLGSDNILFALDADEILSMNCMDDGFFDSINTLISGQSVELEWLNIWGDVNTLRRDGIWGGVYKHFIFRDDGVSRFGDVATSEPRMPNICMKDSTRISLVKVLHYQFLDRNRMLAKQRRYRVYDYINSEARGFWRAFKINLLYYPTKLRFLEILEPIPKGWNHESFITKIDLNSGNYWYTQDIIEKMKEYGSGFFSWLDIWDVDWNLLSQYFSGENFDFSDKRSKIQKVYHDSQYLLYFLNKCIPQFIKKKL